MTTTLDRTERELLTARETIHGLTVEIGKLNQTLVDVARQRDVLQRLLDEHAAEQARTESAIDSIAHHGLRRLMWIAQGPKELERLLAECDAPHGELVDLGRDLLDEKDPCAAENLVRRAMGLDH